MLALCRSSSPSPSLMLASDPLFTEVLFVQNFSAMTSSLLERLEGTAGASSPMLQVVIPRGIGPSSPKAVPLQSANSVPAELIIIIHGAAAAAAAAACSCHPTHPLKLWTCTSEGSAWPRASYKTTGVCLELLTVATWLPFSSCSGILPSCSGRGSCSSEAAVQSLISLKSLLLPLLMPQTVLVALSNSTSIIALPGKASCSMAQASATAALLAAEAQELRGADAPG
mmetsp:Transcript_89834/g.225923  ORF Transcript_89834/g.225923 Transcript_89834/m.225923 type:complete len:227 (+) Transcript_89834:307-987(+)